MRISDWSSDVCSSDLIAGRHDHAERGRRKPGRFGIYSRTASDETNGSPRRDRTGGRVSPFRPVELHDGEPDDRRWRNLRPVGVMATRTRSQEPTSELQSLMRISNDDFCVKKKTQ